MNITNKPIDERKRVSLSLITLYRVLQNKTASTNGSVFWAVWTAVLCCISFYKETLQSTNKLQGMQWGLVLTWSKGINSYKRVILPKQRIDYMREIWLSFVSISFQVWVHNPSHWNEERIGETVKPNLYLRQN